MQSLKAGDQVRHRESGELYIVIHVDSDGTIRCFRPSFDEPAVYLEPDEVVLPPPPTIRVVRPRSGW